MSFSSRSKLCSTVLAMALVLDPRSVLGSGDDDLRERVFAVTNLTESVPYRRGFTAACGGNVIWFQETTLAEARELGGEFIVLSEHIRTISESSSKDDPLRDCFSDKGIVFRCDPASIQQIDDGWEACAVMSFNDPKSSIMGAVRNYLSGLTSHLKENALIYLTGSAVIALISVSVAYHIHKKNRELSMTLNDYLSE